MSTRNLTEPKKQALSSAFLKVLANAGITNLDFDLATFLDRGRTVTDVWVDEVNGNDDFEGFQGRPFRTLSRAAKEVSPEQYSPFTIHVKRGKYADVVKIASSTVHPITIQGEDFDTFVPTAGAWTAAGAMNVPRYFHKGVLLQDGRILVAGGQGGLGPTDVVEIYNPATNTWTTVASMSTNRVALQLITLTDGRVLACGGIGDGQPSLNTAEIYNPTNNTWTATTNMNVARYAAAIVLLNNGNVLVAGGNDGVDRVNTAEIYNPTNNTWTATTNMNVARYSFGAVVLNNGNVLAVSGSETQPGAEIYNPTNNTWTATADMVGVPRFFLDPVKLADGRVLVAGGVGDSGNLNTAEIYNPTNDTWTATPNMNIAHGQAMSVLLADGRVMIAGGSDIDGNITSVVETYNPDPLLVAEPWRYTGGLAEVRQFAAIVRLSNGQVVVAGGQGGGGSVVAVAEKYNPSSSTSSGTITSFAAPTATITGASFPVNDLTGKLLRINDGSFNGNMYPIYSNTSTTIEVGCADAIGGASFDLVTPAVIFRKNIVDDSTTLSQALVHSLVRSAGAQQTTNLTPAPYGLILKNLWLSSDSTHLSKYFVQNSGVVSFQNCIITQTDTGEVGGGTWVTNSDGAGTTINYTNCYISTPRLHRSQLTASSNIYIKNCVWKHTTNNNCLEFDGCGKVGIYTTGSFIVDCGTGIFLNTKGVDTTVRQAGGIYIKKCGTGIAAFGKMNWNGVGDFIITSATNHGIEVRQDAFWSSAGSSLQFGTGAFRILSAGTDGIRLGGSHCFVGLQYANPMVIQNCGGWGIQMGYKGSSTQGNVSRFNLVQMDSNATVAMSSNTSGDITVDGTTATSQADLNGATNKTVADATLQNVVLMTA